MRASGWGLYSGFRKTGTLLSVLANPPTLLRGYPRDDGWSELGLSWSERAALRSPATNRC